MWVSLVFLVHTKYDPNEPIFGLRYVKIRFQGPSNQYINLYIDGSGLILKVNFSTDRKTEKPNNRSLKS